MGYQGILDFWFSETGATSPTAADNKRWFGGGTELDAEITRKFEPLLGQALEHWCDTPHGALAYIVLHDQFPLNIYRRQAQAYQYESLAEEACVQAVARGFDTCLAYGERVFLYMPLMHAENLELQDLGVEKYQQLANEVDESLQDRALGNLKFAQEHRDTVAQFGRFPFRNEVLGRQSTEDEKIFLASGAPRYGQ